jgi:hypothetical protein
MLGKEDDIAERNIRFNDVRPELRVTFLADTVHYVLLGNFQERCKLMNELFFICGIFRQVLRNYGDGERPEVVRKYGLFTPVVDNTPYSGKYGKLLSVRLGAQLVIGTLDNLQDEKNKEDHDKEKNGHNREDVNPPLIVLLRFRINR